MGQEFTHLNCHSSFSLLAGADDVKTLIAKAEKQGMRALAVTDTDGLYGVVEFQKTALEMGVKPIIGVAVTQPGAVERYAVLLPRNMAGYGEVCGIITARKVDDAFGLAPAVAGLSGNVVVISHDVSVITACKLAGRVGSTYLELVNYGDSTSRKKIASLLKVSRGLSIPCVATNNVYFAEPAGHIIHRVLSAIRTNSTIHRLAPDAAVHGEAWLKPPSLMRRLFAETAEAVDNAAAIADSIDFTLELGVTKFPKFFKPGEGDAAPYLKSLAIEGAVRRYGPLSSAVKTRLDYELCVIVNMGYADYFLAVWDIAREAHRRGIPTCGRGSAANSIVCYALEITDLCPIKHDLYFERFLNPERTDHPDIDLDFPWNRRDEIINYVYDRHGHDRVAMISTMNTFRGRSIIREVGKALGVPVEDINRFTSAMSSFSRVSELEEAIRLVPESRSLPIHEEPYKTIIGIGRRIEGHPRSLSIHCAGIVIAPCPITNLVPLQPSGKGYNITQFDMHPIEDMGLVKIDLLAQMGLAVIFDTMSAAKTNYGVEIDWDRLDPVEDESTKELMRTGATMGCFYIESPGMRSLLRKLKVDDFETLVAVSSIIRPGVSDSGMTKAFIERHLGRQAVTYQHPEMERMLKRTYGVMIYQEDVIKVANAVAGMSLGEADSLRKCMSKKRDWERMDKYKARFIEGAALNGVPPDTALEIWRQVESFGGYAFCKAHSASFAILSWRCAYLKAHYPAEFMAAVIANRGGFYDTSAYIEEARRMGLAILPPDVNESCIETSGAMVGRGRL